MRVYSRTTTTTLTTIISGKNCYRAEKIKKIMILIFSETFYISFGSFHNKDVVLPAFSHTYKSAAIWVYKFDSLSLLSPSSPNRKNNFPSTNSIENRKEKRIFPNMQNKRFQSHWIEESSNYWMKRRGGKVILDTQQSKLFKVTEEWNIWRDFVGISDFTLLCEFTTHIYIHIYETERTFLFFSYSAVSEIE